MEYNETALMQIPGERGPFCKSPVNMCLKPAFYTICLQVIHAGPEGSTVRLKRIATLCSRYAAPPPSWKQFNSSFILL